MVTRGADGRPAAVPAMAVRALRSGSRRSVGSSEQNDDHYKERQKKPPTTRVTLTPMRPKATRPSPNAMPT